MMRNISFSNDKLVVLTGILLVFTVMLLTYSVPEERFEKIFSESSQKFSIVAQRKKMSEENLKAATREQRQKLAFEGITFYKNRLSLKKKNYYTPKKKLPVKTKLLLLEFVGLAVLFLTFVLQVVSELRKKGGG